MKCICKFNEIRDVHEVDQFGFIDLAECLSQGVVPSSISNTEDAYNDIDSPDNIMGKPSDVFEAYRMQDFIKSNGKKKED